jgi:hypothetical protein
LMSLAAGLVVNQIDYKQLKKISANYLGDGL